MKAHSLATIFPLIEGEAFDALVEDIRANGLVEPITTYEGAILDGRNRYRACMKTKGEVKPRYEAYTGKDPLAYVISLNVHRRHLDESQRAMSASRLANTSRGGDRKSENQTANLQFDRATTAKLFNISERLVHTASAVNANGIPDLIKAVDAGAIAVSRAAGIAKKPEKEQQTRVAKILSKEREQRETPRGNAIIRAWNSAKPKARILFLQECGESVGQLLRGLKA